MGSGALVGIKQTEKRLLCALLALTMPNSGLGRGAPPHPDACATRMEKPSACPWRRRVGPYICACPGAALPEDSLRKRTQVSTQASDAQCRAVGNKMDPDLFLRKVSTLQAGFRGFLVRRQFQSLRAEYEAIVQEIEGDLSTLQWTGGWIPKPVFLPEAKSPHSWKAEKTSNPQQKLWSPSPDKDSEKELIWEEMVLKKTEKSPANPGSLCREDSAWLQAEQGRKASQGNSRDTSVSKMENADLGLSQSQQELQEQRNHLAMELLWLQQAINSRKEYLILKQTLRSPEASQTRDKPPNTCLKHRGQAYEKTSLHSSCVLDNQSYRDRIIGESHHAEDFSHKGRLKPRKHPDSVTSAGKTTAVSKGRELCYRNSASQLPAALESQAGGDRVTKGPDHGGQPFKETSLQQLKVLEDQIPGDLKFRSPCSRKAETQLPTLSENLNIEDRYSRKPSYKEADSRSAGPCDLSISEGHMIWDETLAGQEQGSLDLIRTKPPKSQPPSAGSSGHGNTSELSPEGWENRGTLQWR
ncbi:IQ domain-containing protein C isoform X1 [Mus caroli]|uniref:IQ domain-containing protein C isoform X1 n=1 Tax=Mus caroli TaxID=10089 RepID=A0A6P5PMS1_MUSCR|nr:IQ domain-containing protein C isoform X1 [Mus caroli]